MGCASNSKVLPSGAAYLAVRQVAQPMLADRMLEPDIRAVRRLIDTGALVAQVGARLAAALHSVPALGRT